MRLFRCISGGQTGADQGALIGAQGAGFPTGGWAPKDFLTEAGNNPSLGTNFGLEDSGLDYVRRTHLNAERSHVTFWFGTGDSKGFYATRTGCRNANKPFLNVTNLSPEAIAVMIDAYYKKVGPSLCINFAGNRESLWPGIQAQVAVVVETALKRFIELE